ncbi:splicing factor YJU2 [Schistocerca gregaria]|uniref:splicing factor YJU2 n=1 Tax=Schistocerca gregaria TaxID=7010 RepID=UPI00211EB34E|nr:splicing factor YJU2 [Schistocerca gregaria]
MSERKVLNKYYPPDFDPSKIPRMKMPKNRQYTVRLMAPFNMRCVTCGEYIYKGKKFNARKEDVEGEDYLGIRIYRFYIKCTRCLQEISFKTDPKNTDYEIEAGATRNFMALKLAEEQAQREEDERREDEATNPMKLLENRTKQSKQELELLESLEELRDLNRRQRSVDFDGMLSQFDDTEIRKRLAEQQEEEDEKFIKSVFGKKKVITEEIVETSNITSTNVSAGNSNEPPQKMARYTEPVQLKTTQTTSVTVKPSSVGSLNAKKPLKGLVRLKSSTGNDSVAIQGSKSFVGTVSSEKSKCDQKPPSASNKNETQAKSVPNGLSLLGSYSGSDSDSS